MNYPKFIEIEDKKYEINTSFKIAIKCSEIADDDSIGDYERALAIIYLLLGEEALEDTRNHEKILELLQKYLSCGKEVKDKDNKPDMNFVEDYDFIVASFMSDFHIDLDNSDMHWWKFMKLMNGLSNSELGNCCVLNNIRNLRNVDISKIKDDKERSKILKAQQEVALNGKQRHYSKEELEAMDEFDKLAKIGRS